MTLKTCFSLPPSRACLEYRQVLPCIRNCYKLHSSTSQRAAQIQSSFSALLQNMHGEHKGKTTFGRKPMAHFGRSGELMLPSPRIKGRGLNKKSTKAAVLSKKGEVHASRFLLPLDTKVIHLLLKGSGTACT